MESKTAIQLAIEEIKVFRKKASFEYKAATTSEDKEEWLSSISAIDSCITVLKDKLPTEKEQIETAYSEGSLNKTENILLDKTKVTAEEYFTNTYGQANT